MPPPPLTPLSRLHGSDAFAYEMSEDDDYGKEGCGKVRGDQIFLWRRSFSFIIMWCVQSGWSVCRTGNGEKINNSQVCFLAQLCLAAA